jgi:hypothetical protein
VSKLGLGEMATQEMRGASGGGAALQPAFAGYGRCEGRPSNKLPSPVLDEIAVLGNAWHEPDINARDAATMSRHYGLHFGERTCHRNRWSPRKNSS